MRGASDTRSSASARLVIVAYALALLALSNDRPAPFPGAVGQDNPNEMSRLDLLEAVFRDHTLTIDGSIARNGDLEDKLVVAGHTYANKPPGLAVLGLPAYAAAFAGARGAGRELSARAGVYAARLLAVSLPALLFLFAFARHLDRRGLDPGARAALLAATAFGTGLLPYGASFTSHATTAALLGLATLVLLEGGTPRDLFRAALLCGLAASCDYTIAIPGGVLLAAAWLRAPSVRGALAGAAGLLPAAVLVLGYNTIVFGNPLDLGYGHHVDPQFAEVHSHGLGGFHLPDPRALAGLLVSRGKGLFAWSPFLVLAAPGAVRAWRAGRRFEAGVLPLAATALVLVIAGYPNWHGGWTTGPRYLVSLTPLLAILVGEALLRPIETATGRPWWSLRTVAAGLGAAAIVTHGLAVLTWPWLPDLLSNPLGDLTAFLVGGLRLAPSASELVGLSAIAGIAIVAASWLLALAIVLAPAPVRGGVLALSALLLFVPAGTGPVTFVRAEVLFRRGDYGDSSTLYRGLLEERPSLALRTLALERMEWMRRARAADPAAR